MVKKKSLLFDLSICFSLGFAAAIVVNLITNGGLPCDSTVLLHLSRIKILTDNFSNVPQWNMWWFFGCPFLRFFPPLSYYIYAFLGWFFHLSVFEALRLGITLVFAVGAVSTYLLAKEVGLKKFGSVVASILFFTSYNLYVWLTGGNILLITAVIFAPLVLFTYLRAVRKTSLTNVICAGAVLFIASLIGDALILGILLICTSIALLIIYPELLAVRVAPNLPPHYTMILPKVLVSTILVAAILGLWWWFPFFTEKGNIGLLLEGFSQESSLSLESLLLPSKGFSGYYYFGVGQLLLVLGGLVVSIKQRLKHHKLVLAWFLLSIICGFLPFLGLPTYFFRWGPYIGLFAAILGGLFFSQIRTLYQRTNLHKHVTLFFCTLLLLVLVYPSVMQANQNAPSVDMSQLGSEWTNPEELAAFEWLQANTKAGERVALSGKETSDLAFNVFTNIPQAYGSELQAMTNEYAYVFWYNSFEVPQVDAIKYAPYFGRNFDTKYFVGTDLHGMSEVYPRVYELEGYSSSLVETVDSEDILVLIIGDDVDYSWVFESISQTNPWEVVLVKGGTSVNKYNLETLKRFDVVYIYGLRHEDIDEGSALLGEYVNDSGGLILDTGKILYEEEISEVSDPFPVSKTMIGESNYYLTGTEETELTEGIDFSKFSGAVFNVSYSSIEYLNDGASVLVADEKRPVVAYWTYGKGKVLWTGLHLAYHAALYRNMEEARLLVGMFRFVAAEPTGVTSSADFEYERPEAINVIVKGASLDDAVWVKVSYYPGWTAYLVDKEGLQKLPIFLAGPDMMLVFPEKEGDFEVRFRFEKTLEITICEYISAAAFISIPLLILFNTYIHRVNSKGLRWDKTRRTGFKNSENKKTK